MATDAIREAMTPGTVTTLGALRPGDVGAFIPESEWFVVYETWPSGKVVVQYDDDHGAAPCLPTRKVRYLGRGRIEPARIVMDGEPDRAAELEAGLTWTEAKPTVPGWYWWRPPYSYPEMIHLFRITEDSPLIMDRRNGIYMAPDVGQFAGPIPQPEEIPAK